MDGWMMGRDCLIVDWFIIVFYFILNELFWSCAVKSRV